MPLVQSATLLLVNFTMPLAWQTASQVTSIALFQDCTGDSLLLFSALKKTGRELITLVAVWKILETL